ncbi:MAG TPA: OmpH family outer membrane protein [Rhizomicrobium sp.]|nr:OmpH family outer membrane protein [Rhizomicrobium sp.]
MKLSNFAARAGYSLAALTLTAAVFAAAPASAQNAPKPTAAGTPAPVILVIDRSAILRASKVGQSIVAQVNGFTQAAEKEFKGQAESLRAQEQQLQQQIAILAPDVKKKKIAAFQAQQEAFQKKVQERQAQIQGGVMQARQQVEAALGPILQGLMAERHANLLLDRSAIVLGTVNIDITGAAVQRLNQKLPNIKVQLVNPPPGVLAQMQQQQQGQ